MMQLAQHKTKIAVLILLLVAAAGAGAAYYFYQHYQEAQRLLSDPEAVAREEVKAMVAHIGTFIELPEGEEPTVATVSDKTKLQEQPFFVKAENGDKVLIYTQAKKAILYRPSAGKIIEVAPINIGEGEAAAGEAGLAPATVSATVALYNGTSVTGLTKKVEGELTQQFPAVTVVAKVNAKKNTYENTVVVDLTGEKTSEAQQLAASLGGTVGELPEGEEKPEGADILVIIGEDKAS